MIRLVTTLLLALAACGARSTDYSAWRPDRAHWNGDCCWGHGPGDDFEWWYFLEFWRTHPEATCADVPPEGRQWKCLKS